MANTVLPVDAAGLKALSDSIYRAGYKQLHDQGAPDWLAIPAAGLVSVAMMAIPAIFAAFANGLITVGSFFAVQFLGTIDNLKQTNKSDFNNVIAASTNELLGTDINGDQLTGGSGAGGSMEDNLALGKALIGIFEEAFGGLQPVTPQQGADNAKKFAGWAINFSTNQGFLSILTEACSIGLLKEFHELPEALKSSLGIGRLQRAALAPLVRNCISQPYDLYLKYLLRPDRLAEGQIVRALKAGQLDDTTARQMLAEKGYRDSDIDLLIADLAAKIAAGELFTLVRNGDLTLDQALAKLTDAGMDADNAKLQMKALDEGKADSQVGGILSDLEGAFTDGFIDSVAYNAALDKLPLSDSEDAMFRMKVGLHQERPRKRITFAQMQKGIVEGVVDFSYMDTWLTAEGYGPDDQNILTFEVLTALKGAEDKVKFMEYKANVLRKAGKPVPPWLLPG
jgi:hypothetical protein